MPIFVLKQTLLCSKAQAPISTQYCLLLQNTYNFFKPSNMAIYIVYLQQSSFSVELAIFFDLQLLLGTNMLWSSIAHFSLVNELFSFFNRLELPGAAQCICPTFSSSSCFISNLALDIIKMTFFVRGSSSFRSSQILDYIFRKYYKVNVFGLSQFPFKLL